MTAQIFIDEDFIGEVFLKEIDRSMGVLGGELLPTELYQKYKHLIQEIFERENRCANVTDFSFRASIEDVELKPEGGISVTDAVQFDEIIVDIAGLHWELVDRVITSQRN